MSFDVILLGRFRSSFIPCLLRMEVKIFMRLGILRLPYLKVKTHLENENKPKKKVITFLKIYNLLKVYWLCKQLLGTCLKYIYYKLLASWECRENNQNFPWKGWQTLLKVIFMKISYHGHLIMICYQFHYVMIICTESGVVNSLTPNHTSVLGLQQRLSVYLDF